MGPYPVGNVKSLIVDHDNVSVFLCVYFDFKKEQIVDPNRTVWP